MLFVSNIIIDTSYNLNEYIQCKHNGTFFEVGCFYLHTVINGINWMEMKNCSKFLSIPVIDAHLTDRN